ncbi:hypothetical protein MMC22_008099 [Lobaria immixta]|nr:hypothetical protein [Lobaria immixta]
MDYYDRVKKEPSVYQKLVVCASIGNKLETMQTNLLAHVIKNLNESDKGNVEKSENNPKHSTAKYANIAAHMDRKVFQKKTNLSGSCFDLLKQYPRLVAQRSSLAHGSEGAFAKLLMSPQYRNTNHYYQWAPFFPYCYGKTLEEMAKSGAGNDIEDLYSIGE